MQEITKLIGFIGIGCSSFPILFCIFNSLYKTTSVSKKLILFVSATYFISNFTNLFLYLFTSVNQNFLINIFTSIEFFLLLFFYIKNLTDFISRRILNRILLFFVGFSLFTLFTHSINENYTLLNIIQKLGLLFCSLLFLYFAYTSNKHDKLTNAPFFWINTSILIFNASSLYISIFENVLRAENIEIFYNLWPIIQTLGIAHYLLLSIGIWKLKN